MIPELPTQHPEIFRRSRINEHGGTYTRYRNWLENDGAEVLDTPSKYTREDLEAMTTRQLEIAYLKTLHSFLSQDAVQREITEGKITLGYIKPNADQAGNLPKGVEEDHNAARYILDDIVRKRWPSPDGIIATFAVPLSREQAAYLYAEHSNKPFFGELLDFATSGPVTFLLLRDEQGRAVKRWRDLIGHTDPSQASFDSIRGTFAPNIHNNIVHGSDSADTAGREMAFLDSVVCDWLEFLQGES